MPEQASSWAARVDFINNFITYVAVFCTVAITGAMLYFAWRYRRRPDHQESEYITHDATLETVWTAIPTLVCIFVFYYGFVVYKEMREPPANAIEINVEGYRWAWEYTYPNGKKAGRDLVVPVGEPVRLILRSRDVNHSFFIPAMRVKEDVIKSEYHHLWFEPTITGDFHIFCTEYCGTSHSGMIGTLKVVSKEQYLDFLNDRSKEQLSPEQLGQKLYESRGCVACHRLDGVKGVGPSFKGIFGQKVEFTDGTSATRDENYLRESILHSQKKIVKDFLPGAMPSFEGQLKEEEVAGLIAFIKAQK